MNDTESRLRDYLDTKAATIPSTSQGPGLLEDLPRRRPVWPILATAASVAAVLALTVTVLTHLGPDKAAPAAPPTDAAPKVPYTVTNTNWKGSVYDGSQTVRLPNGVTTVASRVDAGWLINGGAKSPSGILTADGKVRPLGPKMSFGPILSPDRKQVAMTIYPTSTTTRIAVYDLAGGTEVSSIASPSRMAGTVNWNKDGIWLDSGDPYAEERLYVWKPGQPSARPVQVPGGFFSSATAANSDMVVFAKGAERTKPKPGQNFATTRPTPKGSGPEPERCFQIGVLRDAALDVRREYCDKGFQALYPVISPDGGKVLHSVESLTIDVATGKTTKLDLPDEIESWPSPVFEDATKVLVVTRPEMGKGPQRLYRCEVTTGECKLLRTEKDNRITLARP
ncbi:hypothetical protein GCM10009745_41860 [Kribbella yunnanensis]|uniref:WD40 repeat domain-containing protein n=1 Tax=Kribbella yunnanensis TaxID=190194 RepID=A0ABP4TS73_9ACTN